MFKMGFKANGGGGGGGRDDVIGHDRFCQHRTSTIPRYRKRRHLQNKRNPIETELALELISYTAGPSNTSANAPVANLARSMCEIKWPKTTDSALPSPCIGLDTRRLIPQSSSRDPADEINGFITHQMHPSEARSTASSWESISKFFSSVANTFSCRDSPKDSSNLSRINHIKSLQYDYSQLSDKLLGTELNELNYPRQDSKVRSTVNQNGMIRSEKTAGHLACMHYLKGANGRYVLLDQLPDIGWRTNRLWYLVCDSRVCAERVLTVTSCSTISPLIDPTSKNAMIQACRSLQHPYVCPILDLEIVAIDNFDRPFAIVVMPVTTWGSVRDLQHKSPWADTWRSKYIGKGTGFPEIQAQRLSCHILEAMLELRMKGLPAGIGSHLHPGNILIQNGTARFSALDNILLQNPSRVLPYVTRNISTNPEAIDSIAFAYLLFSMCTGYEIVTPKLSMQNWNDIHEYTQVCQVLEFVLKNPENRIPSLTEIVRLDFYRTIDLRELRSMPLANVIAAPPIPPVPTLLEQVYYNKLRIGKKSRSTSSIYRPGGVVTNTLVPSPNAEVLRTNRAVLQRTISTSTPSLLTKKGHTFCTEVVAHKEETDSMSSQVSIYCTPPSSLSFPCDTAGQSTSTNSQNTNHENKSSNGA